MIELELPWPPSVNHYWRRVGPKTLISREGREFRKEVLRILAARRALPLTGALEVAVDLFPPDRRLRDIDNSPKALLDSLTHGGVYHDDAQIDRLTITRCSIVKGGKALVQIKPYVKRDMPVSQPSLDPMARPRSCLKCDKMFDSSGPANRICIPCGRTNERLHLSERQVDKQRGAKRHNGESLSIED